MPEILNRPLRVFLCHASADKPAVRDLYKKLIVAGIDAWLDQEKLLPGQKWQEEIPKIVKNSDIVIVCLSKNSINKEGYIQKEIKFALDIADEKPEGTIYIIPARLDECDVPERFSKYHRVDLFERASYKKLLLALILRGQQIGTVSPDNTNEVLNNVLTQFREEILKPFFEYVKSGESFYIVGAPNMGETRLMDFILGDDPESLWSDRKRVKKHYLGDKVAARTWLVCVDMNRLRSENDWEFRFFELLLSTVLFACNKNESTEENENLRIALAALDSEVIESKDALKAHRLFEMAVSMLCQSYDIKICFLFREFDETYKKMPHELFAHLRAVRDANKYRVSYALFLRNLPEKLCDPLENEGFYELISRNMLGIGPYSPQDGYHIINQLEKRREFTLPQTKREWLYIASGGHPGLIQALFAIFKEHPNTTAQVENANWFVRQESVQKEFRKLWIGLLEEEQNGLLEFARGNHITMSQDTGKLLTAKGLLKPAAGGIDFFSPMFEPWLLKL